MSDPPDLNALRPGLVRRRRRHRHRLLRRHLLHQSLRRRRHHRHRRRRRHPAAAAATEKGVSLNAVGIHRKRIPSLLIEKWIEVNRDGIVAVDAVAV